jgi:hypothetical protein
MKGLAMANGGLADEIREARRILDEVITDAEAAAENSQWRPEGALWTSALHDLRRVLDELELLAEQRDSGGADKDWITKWASAIQFARTIWEILNEIREKFG